MSCHFFGTLHAFWNGAVVEGARSLLYFDGDGLGRHICTLVARLLLGLLVTAAAALRERTAAPAPSLAKHARPRGDRRRLITGVG